MSLEKSLDRLSHISEFAQFLQCVQDERESCIAALFDSETHKIQQISGQILAYDQILKMSDAERILFRHAEKTH